MWVISGKYNCYQIKTLDGMNTQPMTARVKEDTFNILIIILFMKIKLD